MADRLSSEGVPRPSMLRTTFPSQICGDSKALLLRKPTNSERRASGFRPPTWVPEERTLIRFGKSVGTTSPTRSRRRTTNALRRDCSALHAWRRAHAGPWRTRCRPSSATRTAPSSRPPRRRARRRSCRQRSQHRIFRLQWTHRPRASRRAWLVRCFRLFDVRTSRPTSRTRWRRARLGRRRRLCLLPQGTAHLRSLRWRRAASLASYAWVFGRPSARYKARPRQPRTTPLRSADPLCRPHPPSSPQSPLSPPSRPRDPLPRRRPLSAGARGHSTRRRSE
jgi:hypothetical protein